MIKSSVVMVVGLVGVMGMGCAAASHREVNDANAAFGGARNLGAHETKETLAA